jgi:hypothetical protein
MALDLHHESVAPIASRPFPLAVIRGPIAALRGALAQRAGSIAWLARGQRVEIDLCLDAL